MNPPLRSRLSFAPAFLLAACAGSLLVDTAGRPVRSPLVVASTQDFRLAADSAEAGFRAVAEVLIDGNAERHVTLNGANGDPPVFPVAIVREAPVCARAHFVTNDPDPRMRDIPRDDPQQCDQFTQIVRAEFRLRRRPQLGESVYVNVGATPRGARWSAP